MAQAPISIVPPTIQGLKSKWNDFMPAYSTHLEPPAIPLSRLLRESLQLQKGQKLLEVACGSGLAALEFATSAAGQPGIVDVTCVDLADGKLLVLSSLSLPAAPHVRSWLSDGRGGEGSPQESFQLSRDERK